MQREDLPFRKDGRFNASLRDGVVRASKLPRRWAGTGLGISWAVELQPGSITDKLSRNLICWRNTHSSLPLDLFLLSHPSTTSTSLSHRDTPLTLSPLWPASPSAARPKSPSSIVSLLFHNSTPRNPLPPSAHPLPARSPCLLGITDRPGFCQNGRQRNSQTPSTATQLSLDQGSNCKSCHCLPSEHNPRRIPAHPTRRT